MTKHYTSRCENHFGQDNKLVCSRKIFENHAILLNHTLLCVTKTYNCLQKVILLL
jgi:hypothetical protein